MSDRFLDSSLAYQGAARGLGRGRGGRGERARHRRPAARPHPAARPRSRGRARARGRGGPLRGRGGGAAARGGRRPTRSWPTPTRGAGGGSTPRGRPRRCTRTCWPRCAPPARERPRDPLAGAEDHPHARMALESALARRRLARLPLPRPRRRGQGRGGARVRGRAARRGRRAIPTASRRRVEAGVHPDLTWVRPTGAHEMRLEDVDEPVIAAATRTPFESSRRVFVLERADTMSDRVANRMLKTLEEPAPFVHLILLTDALAQVLPTVVSRCQLVRFDPLPAERIAEMLRGRRRGRGRAPRPARGWRWATPSGRAGWRREEGEALRAEADSPPGGGAGGRGDATRGAGCSRGRRSAGEARVRPGGGAGREAAGGRAQGPRPHRARAPVRGRGQARDAPRRSARCSTWAWRWRRSACAT